MPADDSLGSLDGLEQAPPDGVVRYTAHEDGLLDVHLPPVLDRPAPLLVLLHGGFWKQAYDRRHTRVVAAALAADGWVVVTPEYRRVGGGGGWPATAADVESATAQAPALLAGLGVASTGTVVLGHSAGGHLALWLANQPLPLTQVVGLAPVGDLRAAARDRLGDGATQALLGGEPSELAARYDEADPMHRLSTRPGCDVRIVHGAEDDIVPAEHSRGLAERHAYVDLRVVPGADHFDLMNPASAAWPDVVAALR